ncbi:MAG: GNAT family N-acetyltransferase [Armatimonadota bacterium]|nr:MAG: GNAT family N-acetyltransferase [Armatimonadota bacterium]
MPELLPLKDDDYPAILTLTRESMDPILRDALGVEFNEDLFRDMLADEETTTLVMHDGDAIAAYVSFYPREDHVFVNWLVVHPTYRNRGFATMLLDEVGRVAAQRNVRLLRICLQENNQPAIALCQAAGFERLAVSPMGWVMEKPVVPERGD